MSDKKSLSHTKREYKYHITWIPKYGKKEKRGYRVDSVPQGGTQIWVIFGDSQWS